MNPWWLSGKESACQYRRREFNPWIKPTSLISPALAGGFFTTSTTWEALYLHYPLTNLIKETFVKKRK